MTSKHESVSIYCTCDFIESIKALRKNNSYNSVDQELIAHLSNKTIEEIVTGDQLIPNSDSFCYTKKRLSGRGGFRLYQYAIFLNSCVYLLYIHAKTGRLGSTNAQGEAIKRFAKNLHIARQNGGLYKVEFGKKKLIFTPHI